MEDTNQQRAECTNHTRHRLALFVPSTENSRMFRGLSNSHMLGSSQSRCNGTLCGQRFGRAGRS
jgi:hypothetical protein